MLICNNFHDLSTQNIADQDTEKNTRIHKIPSLLHEWW